jgi:hypothetical protein
LRSNALHQTRAPQEGLQQNRQDVRQAEHAVGHVGALPLKDADEALQQSRQRRRRVLSFCHDGNYLFDRPDLTASTLSTKKPGNIGLFVRRRHGTRFV